MRKRYLRQCLGVAILGAGMIIASCTAEVEPTSANPRPQSEATDSSGVNTSPVESFEEARRITTDIAKIPVLLPPEIPLNSPAAPEHGNVWAEILEVSTDEYLIAYNRQEECGDLEGCSFALAMGYRHSARRNLPSYQHWEQVRLSNRQIAFFYQKDDDSPAMISFDHGDIRYEFWIYKADQNDVLTMANNALN